MELVLHLNHVLAIDRLICLNLLEGSYTLIHQLELRSVLEGSYIEDIWMWPFARAVTEKATAVRRKAMRTYIPETTKIIIAQRTSSVEDADRIVVMDNGRIDAIGTSAELLKTNKIYREVYLSQNRQGHEAIEDVAGKGATA